MLGRLTIISKTIAIFSLLSILPKLLVIFKDIVVAFYFGTSQDLDIYLMALMFIGMPISIIVVSLQTSLIPVIAGTDSKHAALLLGSTLRFVFIILLFLLPLWLISLPFLLNIFYASVDELILIKLINSCYWLMPYYFISGINLLLYGALQARRIFWPCALLPGLFPLTTLTVLLIVREADVRLLIFGIIVGSLFELFAIFSILIRERAINFKYVPGSGLANVLVTSIPLMVGMASSALAPIFEQMISFGLGAGNVSLLNYANKIPIALNTVLVTAVGVVIFPHIAELIAAKKWGVCRLMYLRLVIILISLGLVIVSIIAYFARDLISLLFERGAFTASESSETAKIMIIYLVQLPFLLAAMVSQRTLAATGKTWIMSSIGVGQLCISICLSYILSNRFGVIGVASGSSLAVATAAIIFVVVAWQQFYKKISKTNI
jgi:putative peptidoglycan lipid II flippase